MRTSPETDQTFDFVGILDKAIKRLHSSLLQVGIETQCCCTKIYSFQQKGYKSIQDYVSRLRHYVNRCPIQEKPSQGHLISIFFEGLGKSYFMLICIQESMLHSMSVKLMLSIMMIVLEYQACLELNSKPKKENLVVKGQILVILAKILTRKE